MPAGMMKALVEYDWPGNVRELENYIERIVVMAQGRRAAFDPIEPPGRTQWRLRSAGVRGDDLASLIRQVVRVGIQTIPPEDRKLYKHVVQGVERELIDQVLKICDHVQVKAAKRLGINRNTLHKKIQELTEGYPTPVRDDGNELAG
jgi:DNA-binding NtrC family response regulator